jgi:hypothetical protein
MLSPVSHVWKFAGAEPDTLVTPRRSIGEGGGKTSDTAPDTSPVRFDFTPDPIFSSLPPGNHYITGHG